jgi:hypothetical protein
MDFYIPSTEALLSNPWVTFYGIMFIVSLLSVFLVCFGPMLRAFNRGDNHRGLFYLVLATILLGVGLALGNLGTNHMSDPATQIEPPTEFDPSPSPPEPTPAIHLS